MKEWFLIMLICFIGFIIGFLIRLLDAQQKHKNNFSWNLFWKMNDIIILLNFFVNALYFICFMYRGIQGDNELIILGMLSVGGYFFFEKVFKMFTRKFFPNFDERKFNK